LDVAVGLRVTPHNHEVESASLGGELPYDLLSRDTGPRSDLTTIGRFARCHLQDMGFPGAMTETGAGWLDVGALFAVRELAGLRHY